MFNLNLPFLDITFWGNTLQSYILTILVFLVLFSLFRFFRIKVLGRLRKLTKKTETRADDVLIQKLEGIPNVIYLYFSFCIAGNIFLKIAKDLYQIFFGIFLIMLVYQIVRIGQATLFSYLEQRREFRNNKTPLQGIKVILNIAIWSTAGLMVFSNLGFNITALAASLGVGGIAIALAAQNILGDLFSSFSIFFDKPFKIGDYIIIGDHDGTVKKIGLKTTRLETLRGEELVISNKELTESRIQNFGKLHNRRVDFTLGVEYGTPKEKLERIPEILKNLMEDLETVKFEWAVFHELGAFSLDFKVVFFIMDKNYELYIAKRHEINLRIIETFEKEGIGFAFPTQTLHIASKPKD